jgi:ribosome biogenesis GTPase
MKKFNDSTFGDFVCKHCGFPVSANPQVSAVVHRNHCPYCLWSRHLDLYQPGDRLSACKGLMKPMGLCFKKTSKKYSLSNIIGELMLVHQCLDCGSISINRIAADDDPELLMQVYSLSLSLDPRTKNVCFQKKIDLLEEKQESMISDRLFGING